MLGKVAALSPIFELCQAGSFCFIFLVLHTFLLCWGGAAALPVLRSEKRRALRKRATCCAPKCDSGPSWHTATEPHSVECQRFSAREHLERPARSRCRRRLESQSRAPSRVGRRPNWRNAWPAKPRLGTLPFAVE
jgi:hypothetical protein